MRNWLYMALIVLGLLALLIYNALMNASYR